MGRFKADKIDNEKNDPVEGNSLKFIYVPLMLLSAFLGFGITYLALKTDKITMKEGDSRTHEVAQTENPKAAGDDPAELLEKGKQIFTTTCQACHQASGMGIPGTFPPLAGSEWVIGSAQRMVAIVLHGVQGEITVKGEKYQSVMPPFQAQLSSEDVAAVVSYVRSSFGNTASVINKDLVDEVIKNTGSKKDSWAGEAELNSQKWD